MKKATKILVIVCSIVAILSTIGVIISYIAPEGFGDFLLNVYEDLTEDFGHTIKGMYAKLLMICAWIAGVTFVMAIGFGIGVFTIKAFDNSEEDKIEDIPTTTEPETKEKKMKIKKTKTKKEKVVEAEKKVETASNEIVNAAKKSDDIVNDFLTKLRNSR